MKRWTRPRAKDNRLSEEIDQALRRGRKLCSTRLVPRECMDFRIAAEQKAGRGPGAWI